MKKGDVVLAWDDDDNYKTIQFYVEKLETRHCCSSDTDILTSPMFHYTKFDYCEPYTDETYRPGDRVLVTMNGYTSWFLALFIGFMPNGKSVVVRGEDSVQVFDSIKPYNEPVMGLKSQIECFRLLIHNGWIMNQTGVWSHGDVDYTVGPRMICGYVHGCCYPDFLLEEVPQC
jgi:hypothetical protein